MNEQEIRPGSKWAHKRTGRRVTVVGLSMPEGLYYQEYVVYRRDSNPDRLVHNDCQSFLWRYRPVVVIDEPKRLYVTPTGKFYDATVLDRGPGDQTIELNPDGTWTVVER